jgi:hypothetical protein
MIRRLVKESNWDTYSDLSNNDKNLINVKSKDILNTISRLHDASILLFNLNNEFLSAGYPTSNFSSLDVNKLNIRVKQAVHDLQYLSLLSNKIEDYAKILKSFGV